MFFSPLLRSEVVFKCRLSTALNRSMTPMEGWLQYFLFWLYCILAGHRVRLTVWFLCNISSCWGRKELQGSCLLFSARSSLNNLDQVWDGWACTHNGELWWGGKQQVFTALYLNNNKITSEMYVVLLAVLNLIYDTLNSIFSIKEFYDAFDSVPDHCEEEEDTPPAPQSDCKCDCQ